MSVGFVLTIMVLTTEEKVFIVEHYSWSYGVGHQNGPSLHHVREHYKEQFNKAAPSNKTILAIVEKFHHMGSVLYKRTGTTGCPRTVTTNKNHERLLQQVLQSPKHTLRWTSLKLSVSDRSVRRMFKELGGFAYHIQVAQHLTEAGPITVLSMTYVDADFFSNIWFSDERHIHLNGNINQQTTSFLGFELPDDVVEKSLHSAQVMIWCAISRCGILGPYFVEDDAQNTLTVNQESYKEIITAHLCGIWEVFAVTETCHCDDSGCSKMELQPIRRGKGSLAYLQQHFDDRLISRGTKFSSPSHSPDLTALDCLHMRHAERIHFPIRWPTWKCSRITGENTVFFVPLQQSVFISMDNNLKDRYEQCVRREDTHFEHMLYRHI